MNFQLFLCIASGVAVAHLAVFVIVTHVQSGMRPPAPKPPPPTFTYKESVQTDTKTGEKTRYKEFTVSTKLAEDGPMATVR